MNCCSPCLRSVISVAAGIFQEKFKLWTAQNKALAALLEDSISGKVHTVHVEL